MYLKTKGIALGLVLAASLVLQPALAADLRLGGVHAPNSFETQGLKKFAELAEKKSDGSVKVTVYPAGQLGNERAMIDMISVGAIDMFANVADWNQHLLKDFAVLSMPFAFRDLEHLKKFQGSATYTRLKEQMRTEKNVRVLADNWYRLPRVLLTKQPVAGIKDVQGLKLRMPDIESFVKTWSAFGAKPAIVPFAEAFIAIKTGVVDGMEAPLSAIYAQKFYQVAPNVTMTNHGMAPFNIMMNEKSYAKLSAAEQKALTEAAKEAGDFYTQLIEDQFKDQRKKMEAEGAKFVKIPLEPFTQQAGDIAAEFENRGLWRKGLFAEIQK